jgi:hypothetical protein
MRKVTGQTERRFVAFRATPALQSAQRVGFGLETDFRPAIGAHLR